jgi:hypothetical protein
MRIFTAVWAHKNYLIGDGDATNEFAQAAPPTEPTFVKVDLPYQNWCRERHGK